MAGIDEEDFKEERVRSWEGLMKKIRKLDEGKWMYRGQTSNWALETKFERTLNEKIIHWHASGTNNRCASD